MVLRSANVQHGEVRTVLRRIAVVLVLACGLAPGLGAQDLAGIPPGALVRVFASPPGAWRTATVVSITVTLSD